MFKIARITDPQKIENLKRAAMEIIAEDGYKSASIASIAQKAGVSVGYLYRYYRSKEELRKDIMHTYFKESMDYFFQSIESCETVSEIFNNIVKTMFESAKSDPLQVKFVAVLMLELDADFMFQDFNDYITLDAFLSRVHSIGINTKEINSRVTKEEIELVLMSITTKYFLNKLKEENYVEMLGEESAKRIAELCLKALS